MRYHLEGGPRKAKRVAALAVGTSGRAMAIRVEEVWKATVQSFSTGV